MLLSNVLYVLRASGNEFGSVIAYVKVQILAKTFIQDFVGTISYD